MSIPKPKYGDRALIGLPVSLKQLRLHSCPGMPDARDFLPFMLVGYLGKGGVRLTLMGGPSTYKAKFTDLIFTDPLYEATVKKMHEVMFSQ